MEKQKQALNPNAHQLTSTTKLDRYPEIFKTVKKHFTEKNITPGKIMSFGCSTGEECLTAKNYFPNSKIVGVDTNLKSLKKCREKITGKDFTFITSTQELLIQQGPFHIIFCMSVLCRWEDTQYVDNCSEIYPFEKFDRQLTLLDQLMAPGGVLVIYNSNFRMSDTSVYNNYQPIRSSLVSESGFVHKFNKSNQKIPNQYSDCVFVKLPG